MLLSVLIGTKGHISKSDESNNTTLYLISAVAIAIWVMLVFVISNPFTTDFKIIGSRVLLANITTRAAGVDCYQKGSSSHKANMKLVNYKRIIDESKGKTFQVALGGAGDPNKHDDFGEILSYTRANGIIPNMTTSGVDISDWEIELISEYCGAVAVSYYSNLVSGEETNEQC